MSRKTGPRAGGPEARRSFNPGQKLELLSRYEQAVVVGEGGRSCGLRGLYSSLMTQPRRVSGPRWPCLSGAGPGRGLVAG